MRIKLGRSLALSDIGFSESDGHVFGIATDSREVLAGDLFLAIRGEKEDGAKYVGQALQNGAAAVLCETEVLGCKSRRVGSVTQEIGTIAKRYADTVRHLTVAVTGSVGKSTVIAYTKDVLSSEFCVHAPAGNHNTDLSLPLTMLSMPPDTEVLLLEMGARQSGDIRRLSMLARPQIAAITNIGSSHLQTFGTRDGILAAKSEITCGMEREGLLLLNTDDPYLCRYAERAEQNVITLSMRDRSADYTLDRSEFSRGNAACYASLFAYAIGDLLGVEDAKYKATLAHSAAPPMRQEKIECGGILYLMDAYNASPESMLAVFPLLKPYIASQRRVYAVLGDMLELGEESRMLHRTVGDAFGQLGATGLFCYGDLAREIGAGAEAAGMRAQTVFYYSASEEPSLTNALSKCLAPGDVLLLKGSRGMRLDRLLSGLLEKKRMP